jgi:hypothetical protein
MPCPRYTCEALQDAGSRRSWGQAMSPDNQEFCPNGKRSIVAFIAHSYRCYLILQSFTRNVWRHVLLPAHATLTTAMTAMTQRV